MPELHDWRRPGDPSDEAIIAACRVLDADWHDDKDHTPSGAATWDLAVEVLRAASASFSKDEEGGRRHRVRLAVDAPSVSQQEAALRWYADEHRYRGHDPEVLNDCGHRARAVAVVSQQGTGNGEREREHEVVMEAIAAEFGACSNVTADAVLDALERVRALAARPSPQQEGGGHG